MLTLFIAWLVKNWRIAAITAGIVFLLIGSVVVLKSCKRQPKLERKEVLEAQQSIDSGERTKAIEILSKAKAQESDIDSNVKAAEEATEKAKRDLSQKTNAELAEELERLK